MTGFTAFIVVFLYILIVIGTGRYFYCLELRAASRRLTRKLGLDILKQDYSFEQIVYFISLPSNMPAVRHAGRDNLIIKLDYRSLFFPRLSGLKIYIQAGHERIAVAYLRIKDFRLPALDQILEQGRINESDYLKMSTCKLIHPVTLNEISDEVYRQIQLGRRRRNAEEGAAKNAKRTVKEI